MLLNPPSKDAMPMRQNTNGSASGPYDDAAARSDSSRQAAAAATTQPQQVADVHGGELCPSLHRLFAAHRPHSKFHRLLLALHCLMVESGFAAVNDSPESASTVTAAADYSLPVSVAEQLLQGGASVSIAYAYSRAQPVPARALLKVVNTGRLAACHCGVAASPGEPAAVCASAHYNIDRHVGHDSAGNVSFSGFRHLSLHFKDTMAERAKAAIHEACGLPPLGLAGLPTELLLRVMRHCDFVSVCRLAQASSRLSRLGADSSVWREQLKRLPSGSEIYRQARSAEQRGEAVSYYEAFRAVHAERSQRLRMISRLSSRELSLSVLDTLPNGFLAPRTAAGGRSGRGGRFSLDLDLFPELPEAHLGGLHRDFYFGPPEEQPPF